MLYKKNVRYHFIKILNNNNVAAAEKQNARVAFDDE